VAVKVSAKLQRSTSHKIGNVAKRIVEKYHNTIDLSVEDPENKGLENALSQLVLSERLMILVSTNSSSNIGCYFLCLREQGLKRLRECFESGVMKDVLKDVFTQLADINEPIVIRSLKWSSFKHLRSIQQLSELRELGKSVVDNVMLTEFDRQSEVLLSCIEANFAFEKDQKWSNRSVRLADFWHSWLTFAGTRSIKFDDE
jgi:hypothetical protein